MSLGWQGSDEFFAMHIALRKPAWRNRHTIRYADDVILNKRDLYIPGRAGTVPRNHHAQIRTSTGNESPGSTWQRCLLRRQLTRPTNVQFDANHQRQETNRDARALHHPMVTTVAPCKKPVVRTVQWNGRSRLPEGTGDARKVLSFPKDPEVAKFQFFPPRTQRRLRSCCSMNRIVMSWC